MKSIHPLPLWSIALLLAGGSLLLVPPFYEGLSQLAGGRPWIQMLIGGASIVVAALLFWRSES